MLCGADVGLLLRAPSRVNEVSTPVKLGEYLSSGVPVPVSRIAGWASEIVDDAGAGVAVSWFGASDPARQQEAAHAIDALRADAAGDRDRAPDLCRRRFVWSARTALVRHAYATSLRGTSEGEHQDPDEHDTQPTGPEVTTAGAT